MNDNMQFPIPNSVLEPYIKAAISTAIAAALGDGVSLVEKAVHAALTTKVNSGGTVSDRNYDNTHDLVSLIATKKIQEVAKTVINEMADGMRPAIEKSIRSQLSKRQDVIAKTMVDGLIQSLKTSWNINIKIEPPSER